MTDKVRERPGPHWHRIVDWLRDAKHHELITFGARDDLEDIVAKAHNDGWKEGYTKGVDTIWNAKNAEGLTPIQAAKKSGMEEAAKDVDRAAAEWEGQSKEYPDNADLREITERVSIAIHDIAAAIREKINKVG